MSGRTCPKVVGSGTQQPLLQDGLSEQIPVHEGLGELVKNSFFGDLDRGPDLEKAGPYGTGLPFLGNFDRGFSYLLFDQQEHLISKATEENQGRTL